MILFWVLIAAVGWTCTIQTHPETTSVVLCRKALQLLRHVLIENPEDAKTACSQGLPELVAGLVNTADNDVRLVALLLTSQLIIDAGAAKKFEKVSLSVTSCLLSSQAMPKSADRYQSRLQRLRGHITKRLWTCITWKRKSCCTARQAFQ